MGLKQSQIEDTNKTLQKQDNHYGGTVVFYPNEYKYSVFQKVIIDSQSIEKFKQLIQKRKSLSHPNLILPASYRMKQIEQYCALDKLYDVQIQYQYVTRKLEDQISKYCKQRRPFPQNQLRKIFTNVVDCLYYLKKNYTCHGDIKPGNIMFDNLGNVKLIDAFFVNGGKTGFQMVLQNASSMSLLSPEQLEILKKKSHPSIKNIHQSEMWCVGLSMLQSMTAQAAMQTYDLGNLCLKKNHLERKYSQLISNGYSVQITQLVLSCLKPEKERPSFSQFLNILNKKKILH